MVAKAAKRFLKSKTKRPYPWIENYPPGVEWDVEIPVAPLYEILDQAVATYADRPCVDFLDKKYSYAEMGDLVDRAAKGLAGLGVGKGSKVGLFLPNCPYSVIFYFAILKAGGTVVNCNPLYAERELQFQIENSEADIMVTLDLKLLYDRIAPLLATTRLEKIIVCRMAEALPVPKNWLFPLLRRGQIARIPDDGNHVRYRDLLANDGAFTPPEIDPLEDVAVLQYTGGTTGVPKGAMLTHANLYANVRQIDMWFTGRRPGEEKILAVLPLFHVFGMTAIMNASLYAGAEIILLPRFDIAEVLATIQRKKPTLFAGVPTMFTAINNFEGRGKYDLSSLRYCNSGGDSMPLEVMKAFEESSGASIREGYGLSETSPVVAANPFDGERKVGSVGMPYPATVVTIVDLENPKKIMPQGESGEIAVTGPQVMKGYWKMPEETEATMVSGRFLTGDIGYLDEDGYLFIVDRKKELIIASGYNIYPRHVEEALYEHPAIEEAAVVGVPDEYRGQTVKAFIVLKAGQSLDKDDLTEFLRDKLAAYELPKQVEFRDELPKTAVGKIEKKALLAPEEPTK